MDLACPKEHATEILSDSDHLTKIDSTTVSKVRLGLTSASAVCLAPLGLTTKGGLQRCQIQPLKQ